MSAEHKLAMKGSEPELDLSKTNLASRESYLHQAYMSGGISEDMFVEAEKHPILKAAVLDFLSEDIGTPFRESRNLGNEVPASLFLSSSEAGMFDISSSSQEKAAESLYDTFITGRCNEFLAMSTEKRLIVYPELVSLEGRIDTLSISKLIASNLITCEAGRAALISPEFCQEIISKY